ncbi:transcriptional regulator family: Zinc finger, MIZ-type [Aspergillus niger]|nr:transcriptional regulator family: Zinc finger, MIZ-type [Aspergillus niger]KAI2987063.1 transcriptional regulator family: Zinc finger, MIZ-type [Aspergillus niger]KAI3020126.1 transcriptional regulator family: Zinc finger, MIZ-type [Aspergillus niger]SPB47248.1 unnamed protein product [Aspergillus niger]
MIPPGNRRGDPANLGFKSSNSTAHLFLGGVQRSWMRGGAAATASQPPHFSSTTSTSPSPTSTTDTAAAAAAATAATEGTASTAASAASGAPAGSPPQTRRRETPPREPPVGLTTTTATSTSTSTAASSSPSSSTITSAAAANPSPLPPLGPMAQPDPLQANSGSDGRNEKEAQPNRGAPILPPLRSITTAFSSSTPLSSGTPTPATAIPPRAFQPTALPSPDPTLPRSHASPVSAIDRHGGPVGLGSSLATLPSPPTRDTPPVSINRPHEPQTRGLPTPATVANTVILPEPVQGATVIPRDQSQTAGNAEPRSQLPGPGDPSAHPQAASWIGIPASPVPQGFQQPLVVRPVPMLPIDRTLCKQWLEKLDTFAAEATRNKIISEVIESPRVRLLQSALLDNDPVYLALHQMYCMASYAPSELRTLPGFGPEQERGFAVVKQLLVDNRRLSGDFLLFCVNFPEPMQQLLALPWWRDALEQVMNSLVLLSQRWDSFEQATRRRGLPPLIEEIIMTFDIRSHVTQYNIFLALYRRLPLQNGEHKLFEIFNRDAKYTDERLDSPKPVSAMRAKKERDIILSMYHKELTSTPRATTANQPHIHSQPVGSPQGAPPHFPQHPASSVPGYEPRVSSHVSIPGTGPVPAPIAYPSQTYNPHSPRTVQMPHHHPLYHHHNPPPMSYPPQVVPSQTQTIHPSPVNTRPQGSVHPQTLLLPSQTTSPHPASVPTGVVPSTTATPGLSPLSHTPASAPTLASPATPASALGPAPVQRRRGRPSRSAPANNQTPTQYRLMPQASMSNQGAPLPSPTSMITPLLPPPGSLPPPNPRPHSLRDGLHQAHMRGPVNRLITQTPAGPQETPLYQYFESFAAKPTPLGQGQWDCRFDWTFSLTKSDVERLAKIEQHGGKLQTTRFITNGQQIFRLRCIRINPSTKTIDDHTWCTTETCWPSVVYIFVNEVELFARRRQHNGKDIPLEITEQLHEGPNTVSMHFLRSPAEMRDQLYAAGVEILNVSDLVSALDAAQILPASESLQQIQKRLTSNPDDEVSIVSEDLVIDLVDPFTARVFNRPVRGRLCTHQECFDHETYITTRALKSGRRTLREDWKCPICKQDARPQMLVIDGFLFNIREELSHTNQLENARSIRVKRDGSWTLKSDTVSSTGQTSGSATAPTSVPPKRKSSDSVASISPASQRPKCERTTSDNLIRVSEPKVIALD